MNVVVSDRTSDLPELFWRGGYWSPPEWECSQMCSMSRRPLAFWQDHKWKCRQCGTQHRALRVVAIDVGDGDGDGNLYETGNREGSVDEWDDRQGRWIDHG